MPKTIANRNPEVGTPAALRAVSRAVGDLRRGLPVGMRSGENACLAVAVELLDDANWAWLCAIGNPQIALTAHRARVLNIAPTGADAVIIRLSPDAALSNIQALADPTDDLDHPLMGPFQVIETDAVAAAAAGLQLCKHAQLLPAVVFVAMTTEQSTRDSEWLWIEGDLVHGYGEAAAATLRQVSQARVPLAGAENTQIVAFRPADGSIEHVAIIVGEPVRKDPVLVRLHSSCFTGDLLSSLRCDCGEQLRGAIEMMAEQGSGVLIYLSQEGRGIGLINKLRAYKLQDQGFDTFDANRRLGFESDERLFAPAAEILQQLGIKRIRLLTNNPEKVTGLTQYGIEVIERVPHAFPPNNHNERYLATKGSRGGHLL